MNKAYPKDIVRSIQKSFKRFLSLAIITALGVTMLTGIYAACQDTYASADRFFDSQNLFDIRILSTLGLTGEDVQALQNIEGVKAAEGGYSETVHTQAQGAQKTAEMTTISLAGLNAPYVKSGRLPQSPGEIAVTQSYLDAAGKSVGDTLTIQEDVEEEDLSTEDEAEAQPSTQPADGEDLNTDVSWDTEVDTGNAETPTFTTLTYTITGVVTDPMYISLDTGKSFRSTATTDYTFYILPEDAHSDVYTAVYLMVRDAVGLNCYSDEYATAVQAVVDRIESQIMAERQGARYDAVMYEAEEKLTDAQSTMEEKFDEADKKFADAQKKLDDATQELLDGEAELDAQEADAKVKFADAHKQIEEGKAKLNDSQSKLDAGKAELEENAKSVAQGKQQLEAAKQQAETGFAQADSQFAEQQAKLDASSAQMEQNVNALKTQFGANWPQAEWDALAAAAAVKTREMIGANPSAQPDPTEVAAATAGEQNVLAAAIAATGDPVLAAYTQSCIESALGMGILTGSQQALDAQKTTYEAQKTQTRQQLSDQESQLSQAQAQINAGDQQLWDGGVALQNGRIELAENEETLKSQEKSATEQFADARQEIAEGRQEIAEGRAELAENQAKYQTKKAEAEQKIADARTDLEDIDPAQWYVQNRTSLESYAGMKDDLSSIDTLGRIFPLIFLVVAILIGLTTMTRMVEEERGLIGTYKALGMGDGAISRKYLLYALIASAVGGMAGCLLGFGVLPQFLMKIFESMYALPVFSLYFDAVYGTLCVLLFIGALVGATALACHGELNHTPAALTRPKSPRAGSRVLLERISFIWNRLKFLNKVTARNLFRYKKRLFMTVIGIMGCTTLVLLGFAIRDSVSGLMPRQYDGIYGYDLLLAADAEDNDDLTVLLDSDAAVIDYLNVQMGSVKVINAAGESESVQLVVVPRGASLDGYIRTLDTAGEAVVPDDSGVLLTQNAAELLGVEAGDTVSLRDEKLTQRQTAVAHVVQNYLGNSVYITQSLYESLLGEYEPGAALVHLSDTLKDPAVYAENLLSGNDFLLTSVSTAALRADFASNFAILNAVITLMIVLAAMLAFVVLFTLSNTNISERVRELATIKVLGFYDREVHAYVNKETLILTGMGILLGLPAGRLLSGFLLAMLKMPSIYFAVTIHPSSYLISGIISFVFALAVNLMTNRTLDRINMVEALKSVE